jgi:hypothetical protein
MVLHTIRLIPSILDARGIETGPALRIVDRFPPQARLLPSATANRIALP